MAKGQKKYYIVTRDVEHLITRWCTTHRSSLKAPDSGFFKRLSNGLESTLIQLFADEAEKESSYPALKNDSKRKKSYETEVSFYDYEDIKDKLSRAPLIPKKDPNSFFWVTLDKVYVGVAPGTEADWCIEITRLYNPDGCVKIGVGTRPEAPEYKQTGEALKSLIHKCASAFRAQRKDGVILMDDGLYSGATMIDVIHRFREESVPIVGVRTALAREQGRDELRKEIRRIRSRDPAFRVAIDTGPGIDAEDIRDWVCERDFFYGVPLGGRTAGDLNGETPTANTDKNRSAIGIPYSTLSTNDLHDCASIKSGAYTLARRTLELSIELWERLDKINDRKFRIGELPRIPRPLDKRSQNAHVVSELKNLLKVAL
jgi:hypothetical protein